jgi:hypothetical protein
VDLIPHRKYRIMMSSVGYIAINRENIGYCAIFGGIVVSEDRRRGDKSRGKKRNMQTIEAFF